MHGCVCVVGFCVLMCYVCDECDKKLFMVTKDLQIFHNFIKEVDDVSGLKSECKIFSQNLYGCYQMTLRML